MHVKVSRGFRHSCKNCGAFALRGFCPTGLLPYNSTLILGQKPRMTRAPEDKSPKDRSLEILTARTEPRTIFLKLLLTLYLI